MRQLIAGNWKMNGLTEAAAAIVGPLRRGADGLSCDVLVCPPATLLTTVAHILVGSPVAVGAQDCHAQTSGAFTGDISAPMLRDAGASHVILGHSERRRDHGETDALVRAKTEAAIAAGLIPIVCVGEDEADRDAGRAHDVICRQLDGSLPDGFAVGGAGVIAYEPCWAIGTGRTPTVADIAATHGEIRAQLVKRLGPGGLRLRILYGGSVKPENAAGLMAVDGVDGALVGGASLSAADFLAIARAARAPY